MTNPFIGRWIYRSFHNLQQPVNDFNELRLWQANLALESNGPDLVKGQLEAGGYVLDVIGAVTLSGAVPTINLRATGVAGTNTDGWIYDYLGTLTLEWPDADNQCPAIVGTVIRTVPHAPNRPAGKTYSFVAVSNENSDPPYKLPESVIAHFADRVHRLHHAVWHGIRGSWNALAAEEKTALEELGWRITGDRVALISPRERTRPAVTNGSGEDFLFFHRQMVVQYRQMMHAANAQLIDWPEIPQPGGSGPANAVPRMWRIASYPNVEKRFSAVKTDALFWSRMRWWEYQFKDPTYLATLTLGELGSIIEYSVHNDMHIRWAAAPRDPETNALLELGRPESDISAKWDHSNYDWLGEFYSSHVNPIFWRLHGWIDDRINDWYAAHEWRHPGGVQREVKGGVDWFQPGTWVTVEHPWVWPAALGGYDHTHDHHDPDLRARRIASAEKVMAILYPPPAFSAAAGDRADAAGRIPGRSSVIGF